MMRRMMCAVFAATVVGLVPTAAAGQTEAGVRGGWSAAKFSGEGLQDVRLQQGFYIAGFLGLSITEALGVEIGGAFTQKGTSIQINGIDLSLEIDYIELPLLARLRIPTGRALSPHLTAGPVISWRARCRADASQGSFFIDAGCDDPSFEGDLDTRSFDLGAQVGAGVSAALGGRSRLHLDALYNTGLTDTHLDPEDSVKNRALIVAAGVSFGIGG